MSALCCPTLSTRISCAGQGTVRGNLDPFDKAGGDAALWDVLETVQLRKSIEEKGGLDATVQEYGENFSVGEKQVICLARALLRRPRLLLLDEATASVDWDTDQLIQSTIRKRFGDATCLIIAHRLQTIIECDRVMVLSAGRLAEFDSPANLLRRETSMFAGMVAEVRTAQRIPTGSGSASHSNARGLYADGRERGQFARACVRAGRHTADAIATTNSGG